MDFPTVGQITTAQRTPRKPKKQGNQGNQGEKETRKEMWVQHNCAFPWITDVMHKVFHVYCSFLLWFPGVMELRGNNVVLSLSSVCEAKEKPFAGGCLN